MFMIMPRMAEGLKEKKGEILKVLKLSNKPFSSLPQSISNMNLKALILNGCTRLKNVPSLANLKGLQLLDLSHTSIEELPLGMEELRGLRRLNLAHTKRLKMFRAGVLSKLSSLTDLSMYESKWVWSTSAALEVGGAGVHEISGLPHLSNLALHLADWPDLVACVAHRNDLKLFHLSVGFWGPTRVRVGNAVVISGCYITARGEGSQVILPSNTQQLVVENCQLSELVVVDLLNLKELKECCIKGCHQMKYLVTVEEFTTQACLPNLERIELGRLPNLRALYRGVVPKGTLMNLKVLSISHCHNLMHLFSVRSLKQLHNLERICISDCYAMEEIVVEGDGSEFHNTNYSVVVLPRLKTLVLRYLLNLKSVCRRKLHCVALETIEIGNCPKLRKFPLDEIPTLGLKAIHGGKKWWDTLEWDHTCTKTMLEPRLHHLYEEEFEAA